MPLLEVIATSCGLQLDQYVGRHSMLPFSCFLVRNDATSSPTGRSWSKLVVSRDDYLNPARLPAFCPECASEQKSRRTYSIWRRALQLPGQQVCKQHGCLLFQGRGVDAFMEQPSDLLASGRCHQVPVGEWAADHPAITKLVTFCEAMLTTGRSWFAPVVRAVLAHQASLRGLRTSVSGSLPLVSDLAFETFPAAFIGEILALQKVKRQGIPVSAIDCTVIGWDNVPTGTAAAMAMSLLFNSPSEAIEAFDAAHILTSTVDAA
jgi:hypothetical protein